MSKARVFFYIDVLNTGKFGRVIHNISAVERALTVVGTYTVSVPIDIHTSDPNSTRMHPENSRFPCKSPWLCSY
jgi:hypothetical protein